MDIQCFIDEEIGSFEFEILMPQIQFCRLNILANGTTRQIKERKSKIIAMSVFLHHNSQAKPGDKTAAKLN